MNKKFVLAISITILAIGILWLVFVFFLNKGTIEVQAPAPFVITLSNGRSQNCDTNSCKITVNSGTYTLSISKQGYDNYQENVNVGFLSQISVMPQLRFTPVVISRGSAEDFLKESTATQSNNFSLNSPFSLSDDGTLITYILRNPENFRQNLVFQKVDGNQLSGEPQMITSFIRDLKKYALSISPNKSIVAVVDQSDNQKSALYIIDNVQKTRNLVLSYPFINKIIWLDDAHFLSEVTLPETFEKKLVIYDLSTQKEQQINFQTNMNNAIIISASQIIIAALQDTGLVFVEYNISSNEQRSLASTDYLQLPTKLELVKDVTGKIKEVLFNQQTNLFALELAE